MPEVSVERLALLLGLSLFFGFAFEDFYSEELPRRPGGVRTFPLLALAGGGLFMLEPHYGIAFVAGLLVLGAWIYAYLRRVIKPEAQLPEGLLIVPACNLLAYVLGPITLTQPLWVGVTVTVASVLLLGGRRTLHDWVHRVSTPEIITAAQFLILVGIVLPLLAGKPAIPYTTITPFGVWLAVVAVSSISYASYLLQRFVFPGRATLPMALLGGLYSSTATTVVLSQRARDANMTPELQAGIVAASGMMYVRILAICALFNLNLARALTLPLLTLAVLCGAFAAWRSRSAGRSPTTAEPVNPLQISAALVFAALFVIVSVATTFVQRWLGNAGLFGLAAVVGVTDIDPFVLSLAQGGAGTLALPTMASAIVIATSSNNFLKAAYTVAFSRRRESWVPAGVLSAVAVVGIGLALFLR
ncbi:MAG: DUF4010 domain-containing protein [Candidatus Eremiobacteraeota bacterium]|nr:DUF4010 domain-containing protein [Candidatus Eremiobacteraeota bacterium]